MEESGRSIREDGAVAMPSTPDSWLCDENDRPVMRYVHDGEHRPFRVRVGKVSYEHFSANAEGQWWYRRVR